MSANPPQNAPEESNARIEVMLQWIRQDVNGLLEQSKITNGRMRKAEDNIHDLQAVKVVALKEHEEFSKAVEEWKVVKGQISLIGKGGVIIIVLQIANILLDRFV